MFDSSALRTDSTVLFFKAKISELPGMVLTGNPPRWHQMNPDEIVPHDPRLDDFNSDLVRMGREEMAARLRARMLPLDAGRFLDSVKVS